MPSIIHTSKPLRYLLWISLFLASTQGQAEFGDWSLIDSTQLRFRGLLLSDLEGVMKFYTPQDATISNFVIAKKSNSVLLSITFTADTEVQIGFIPISVTQKVISRMNQAPKAMLADGQKDASCLE